MAMVVSQSVIEALERTARDFEDKAKGVGCPKCHAAARAKCRSSLGVEYDSAYHAERFVLALAVSS